MPYGAVTAMFMIAAWQGDSEQPSQRTSPSLTGRGRVRRAGGAANRGVRGWINHRDHTGFVCTDFFRELSEEGGYTALVDCYPKGVSAYGVFDMAGNSWDWTSSEIAAGNGAERGKKCNAIRGGSWYANANSCRTNYRGGRAPTCRSL